jgi:hypothetical protein
VRGKILRRGKLTLKANLDRLQAVVNWYEISVRGSKNEEHRKKKIYQVV